MKKICILTLIICFSTIVFSQNPTGKVNTKYFRPSITNLYVKPADSRQEVVFSKFKQTEVITKFDDHSIVFPYLSPSSGFDSERIKVYNQQVGKSTNPILAKWWNRDSNGLFNYSFVAKRGQYSATDADAMVSRGSNTNRIEMIGEQLIGKSFILVYEIKELYSMEEYYDKVDAQNRNNANYAPVKRTDEGFVVNYNVYAYKLNFNDSVAAVFYNNYWVDATNRDQAKIAAWSNATFPAIYVDKVSGSVRSTQPKDPKSAAYYSKKKKTTNELLEDIPVKWQEDATFELSKKISDFRLKVTVFKAYPVEAKLGTKEGLYTDQRFYVYEIEVDKKGNQKSNRMGVVRAKKIIDNSGNASGESKPSVFQQQGGRRLYEGMFLESKEDYGLIINVGGNSSTNAAMGGFNIGVDYRLSRQIKIPGIHLGIDASFNSMSDVNPGAIETSTLVLTTDEQKWSGSTMALAAHLSKEMYLSNRGNTYLRPSIGVGISSYTFSQYNGTNLEDLISNYDSKNYNWSSYYVPVSVGLGWNLFPSVSLELKPGLLVRTAATTGNNESLMQTSSPTMFDTWGFNSIGNTSISLFSVFNLRIRL